MKRFFATAIVALLAVSFSARANAVEIQTSGSEVWPGKFMVGADPLGFQLQFSGFGVATPTGTTTVGTAAWIDYKFNINFSGIVANLSKITLWLGGELNLGGRQYLAIVEPGIFVQITLEKLVSRFPLVPILKAGVSGPVYIPYGAAIQAVAGAFEVKIGGGAYYFLTKNIGLGAMTNFGFGPGFAKVTTGTVTTTATGFAGYWDFALGGRFAF